MPTLANKDGWFYYDLPCDVILEQGTWKIQTSRVSESGQTESLSEEKMLEVSKAETRVTLDLTSQAVKFEETVSVSGKFTPEPDCGRNLSEIPITLNFKGPDGRLSTQIVQTENQWGNFLLQDYNKLNLLGEWEIQASFPGNPGYKDSISDALKVRVVGTAGYAIIVQGKTGSEEGFDSHNKTTDFVYNQLKNRGLLDDDIKYFNYNRDQAHVDEIPSKTAIEQAVTQWVADKMNDKPANLY
ncbi:MAG: hypothetical protein GY749_10910, partial [Desulfobacteraceae bacterium]|nr:hypothetical protein [Desulfobacteraceae bacterium]